MRQLILVILVMFLNSLAAAQQNLTTAFSYQGHVVLNGTPIDGQAEMRFSLFDAESGGSSVGSVINFDGSANPFVDVAGGIFSVKLDFGAAALNGQRRWLNIQVRFPIGVGSYLTLAPRQELTGSPYALQTRGLFVDSNNRVGLGTTSPAWKLDIQDSQAVIRVTSATHLNGSVLELRSLSASPSYLGAINFNDWAGSYPGQIAYESGGEHSMLFRVQGSTPVSIAPNRLNVTGQSLVVTGNGSGRSQAAIQSYALSGNAGMSAYFLNNSNFATVHFQNNGVGEVLWLEQGGGVGNHYIVATNGSDWKFWVDAAGITHTKVLQILGGSDLSEKFDVEDERREMRPGMTVSIDPDHEGRLEISRTAYDFRVAGIVSGAGGVNPGMVMGQEGSVADGEHPVALSGRVYCLVDAAYGPVQPGDLLTTSETPGHAMKVTDPARAQGATIGKAMGRLAEGRGLVLVLVGLQ